MWAREGSDDCRWRLIGGVMVAMWDAEIKCGI